MLDYRVIATATQAGADWCELVDEPTRFAIMADGSMRFPCDTLWEFSEYCKEWVKEHSGS